MENRGLESNMKQTVEIVKQVKLTAAQRIALVAAANNKGILHDVSYEVREMLRFLQLVEQVAEHSRAEIDAQVAQAWTDLRESCRTKDGKKARDAFHVIEGADWRRQRQVWRLTNAAKEYLMRGRILITVDQKDAVTREQKRLSA
jgi:hypothetical protein